MRTIVFGLTCLCLLGLVAGCYSDSKEAQAADSLNDTVRSAVRLYQKATGLMKPDLEPVQATQPAAADGKDEAFAALDEAERLLGGALTASQATASGKAPAEMMLAEICRARGDYQARQGAHRALATRRQLDVTVYLLEQAEGLAELAKAQQAAAQGDATQVAELQQRAQQQLDAITKEKGDLDREIKSLQEAVAQLAAQSAEWQQQAAKLRSESLATRGEEALKLIRQSNDMERQVNRNDDQITARQFELEYAQSRKALKVVHINTLEAKLKALGDTGKDIASRVAAAQKESAVQKAKARSLIENEVSESSQAVSDALAEALRLATAAMADYDRAAQANGRAISGFGQQENAAREVLGDEPDSGVQVILEAMHSGSSSVAVLAQKGHIEKAQGDARRQLAWLAEGIAAFGQRAKEVCLTAETSVPANVDKVVAIVAPLKLDDLKTGAIADYDSAAASFGEAAERAARVSRPVDIKATVWMYRAGQAAAQLAKAQITGKPEDKDLARNTLTQILDANPGNPYLGSVRQMLQAVEPAQVDGKATE